MRTCTVCEKQYDDGVTLCPEDGAQTRSENEQPTLVAVDPLIGRMVGSYKISRLLGKGGMGAVYAAEHPAIGAKVAVKFLLEQFTKDKQIVTRFFNEAKAVTQINHDNIVRVMDYSFLDEKMPFFIMEMLGEGYELGKLARPAPLPVAGPIILQICDALAAAHAKGIIHRDLKPDNVFLAERNGRKHYVKLMDFGIAKLVGESAQSQTQTGMVMGTPHYMSPEQAAGRTGGIDARSDIYSLGIMMYQLATGQVPFKGESFAETLVAHIAQPPTPPRELNPQIPIGWEQIILKAIAKQPEDRYQSTRELANDVAELMRAEGCSFELPLADGEHGTGDSSEARTALVTGLSQSTRPTGNHTRLPGSSPGTVALSADQAARLKSAPSTGSRIGLWVACLVIGFGAVVGLRKAGFFGGTADALTRELAQVERELAAVPAAGAPAAKILVTLRSEPSGAFVTVEGATDPVGKTPLTVELERGVRVGFVFDLDGRVVKETVVADSEKTVVATFAEP